jgi:tRNA uridine 5-carbamoylmethylation protein Kti12
MSRILVVTAGLPGSGKSHAMRVLGKILEDKGIWVRYFDSDLFAKRFYDAHPGLEELSDDENKRVRLDLHGRKLDLILSMYDATCEEEVEVVLLDTCFDMQESRALFYEFCTAHGIVLWVLELSCPEEVVRQRIFEERHESERMIGDARSRFAVYKKMKGWWVPVVWEHHLVINSTGDVYGQLSDFVCSELVC